MKKSHLNLLLVLLLCMTSINVSAFYNIQVPNADGVPIYYKMSNWEDTEDAEDVGLEVTYREYNKSSYSGNVVIPEEVIYEGHVYKVTSIGSMAFCNCSGLTSVTIPNGVVSIQDEAFSGCSSLTTVNIPNCVKSIGKYAFSDCTGLTSINIGNGLTYMGDYAFNRCNALMSINISDIAAWCGICFDGINSNPVTMQNRLYLNGEVVREVVIPEGVTSIGDYAFKSCVSLISISLPSSLTSIGTDAFEYTSLTTIHFPNNLKSIGSGAFECCNLTSISIPKSVESIEGSTFAGNYDLTAITVEEGNTKYDSRNNCNALIETANNKLLKGCQNTIIPEGVTAIESAALQGCSGLTSLVIPEGVTSIGRSAFSGCSNLASVTIPNSVTAIGPSAFARCESLTSIYIPGSVTKIEKNTFEYCTKLSSLKIGNGVSIIDKYAFCGCPRLSTITIPNSVTAIGNYSFQYCSSLTNLVIGSGVTGIGISAFESSSKLENVYCYAEQAPLAYDCFKNSNLTNATLHVPAASIEDYGNAYVWQNFGNIVALTDEDPKPAATGIAAPAATQIPIVVGRYTIDGKRISEPQRGLNIIKMSDGTTRKVFVK